MTSIAGAALLYLLQEHPDLMDPAPARATAAQIDHRWQHETHLCLRCDRYAQTAVIVQTTAGPVWLDLCTECAHWARQANMLGTDPDGS